MTRRQRADARWSRLRYYRGERVACSSSERSPGTKDKTGFLSLTLPVQRWAAS